MLNRYDVILLDAIKHPEAKQQPARRFADWLVSPEGQAAIDAYKINGEQLFHPSADAPKKKLVGLIELTADAALLSKMHNSLAAAVRA